MIVEMKDTIAAISTPHGYGGIGIIRISGPESGKIARKIFRPSEASPPTFIPRKLYHGHIVAPGKEAPVDEALLVIMPGPHSYTREDVVEIQAHAGYVVLKEVLQLVIENGARLATPGEFTQRAYLNGRIDLSQAEAVMDIIQAKTELSLKMAARNLEGGVGTASRDIKQKILDINAMVEAQIEFPEELEGDGGEEAQIIKRCQEVRTIIAEMVDGCKTGRILREGLRLVIVGRANVGKSSLLNRFVKMERAIVTEHPGTTRDSIEEIIDIDGLPVVLVDTAGLRTSDDPVEQMGMERTRKLSETADLILLLVDAGVGVIPEDMDIWEEIRTKQKVLVVNKTDLLADTRETILPEGWGEVPTCYTSIKYDKGIDTLKSMIFKFGTEGGATTGSDIVPNLRQGLLLEAVQALMGAAKQGLEEGVSLDAVAIDLKEAMSALDELTGALVKTDVMDTVFSRFCIGK